MNKKIVVCLLTTALLSIAPFVQAQQTKKVPRIGFLAGSRQPYHEEFRQGLRELGYVEGKNILIEYRYAEGKVDRLSDLAAELVRLKVDVIVVAGGASVLAAKNATKTIPIVAAGAGDLVGSGLVASLARPGGNLTGTTNIDPDFSAKRLELLKETFPKLSRVAVLGEQGNRGDQDELGETRTTAQILGIKVQSLEVRDASQFQGAYAAMIKERADALIMFHSSFTLFHRRQLLELAGKNRLPTTCGQAAWAETGCLISYGPSPLDRFRRAALFVDKILKGAKPADLPVEQPTKFELVINLKTAKQIGLTIPQSVLYRADKVIR